MTAKRTGTLPVKPSVAGKKGDPAYAPARTKLGRALRRIRRRIVEDGTPLLTRAQIRKEVAERQGGGR